MTKIPLIIVVVAAVLAVVGLGVPRVMAQFSGHPAQPVGYTHMTHVKQLGLDCTFCHRNVTKGSNASIPAVGQCIFCHRVVNKDNPSVTDAVKQGEIEKVRQAFEKNEPINWVRVHRMPDHVRFVHEAHVRFLSVNTPNDPVGDSLRGGTLSPGAPMPQVCATCHGQVPEMGTAQQVRSLNMGDCLSCHRQNNAPTDCTTCHK